MKSIQTPLILFIITILCHSCFSQPRSNNPEFPYKDFIIATKKMPMINNDNYYRYEKQVFIIDTIAYLSVWDLTQKRLSVFETNSFHLVYQNKNIPFDSYVDDVEIHNFDTIYLLYRDRRLVQTDTSFRTRREWKVEPVSQEYGLNYMLGNLRHVTNNQIYLGHYPDHPVVTKERLAKYFSSHSIIELSKDKPDSIVNYYGRFPKFYWNHNYSTRPCWITFTDGNLIASFGETDSIYKNNIPIAVVRSNYFTKNKEGDIAKIYDETYESQLTTERCRYGRLLYNPYKEHYYRMFHFATHYRNKDGTVNSPAEAKKSIIVTDKEFHILKEIVLPPEYFIYDTYVTPQGLMIKNNDNDDKENIRFDFFDL